MSLQDAIARAITQATGECFRPESRQGVSGGDINTAEILEGGGRRYFVKLNDAARPAMFEAESDGLFEIADSQSVRVPQPVCHGTHTARAFLILEYLDIAPGAGKTDELLGRQLATMHRSTTNEFGWRRDNTIGSTPQINTREPDWVTFYREHRLRFQLELAARNSPGTNLLRRAEQLLEKLPAFFANYQPLPSLLHGDLWGGNHAALRDGTPVIFDPAVYYGDRETDIAMTELFGGYSPGFYTAYNEAWPLDAGYRVRKNLYNLYHLLNHFNLFGGGYGGQGERIIEMLLSEA
jgi:protein-ribulosamine 3-kinase